MKKPLAKERVFYRLNERFVSNRTGDIIFFDKDQNTSLAFRKRRTCRRVPKQKTFP